MGDFLGSYYAHAHNDFDDANISRKMALLKAEQPVSVLDMDSLSQRQRMDMLDALDNHQPESCLHASSDKEIEETLNKAFSADNSDDDLEIPVASMSFFDQNPAPSMVSVQLKTLGSGGLRGRDMDGGEIGEECLLFREGREMLQGERDMEKRSEVGSFPRKGRTCLPVDLQMASTPVSTSSSSAAFRGEGGWKKSNIKSLLKLLGKKKGESRGSKK